MAGFAPVFGSTGRVFVINPLLSLRLWLSQLKMEQRPQPSVFFFILLHIFICPSCRGQPPLRSFMPKILAGVRG